jgi:RNA polymerase sigma-70 factor, ECF subfamily
MRMLASSPNSDLCLSAKAGTAPSVASGEAEEVVLSLFDQRRNSLLRYILSLGLTAHDGEEIIQEVFLALFRHLQHGRSRKNLHGWVFRVAHNLALKQRIAHDRLRGTELDASLMERQLDPGPNPEEQMVCIQRQDRLLAVLRALPEQDQRCLRLRAEGLRYREIAEVLGISLGAVSISLARSLTRLGRADER